MSEPPFATDVVIEQRVLKGSADDYQLQRIATVYIDGEEYRVLAPPRAVGDSLRWLAQACVHQPSNEGFGSEIVIQGAYAIFAIKLAKEALEKNDSDAVTSVSRREESRKTRLRTLLKDLSTFRACGPSDDPDEQTSVIEGYKYLLINVKALSNLPVPSSRSSSTGLTAPVPSSPNTCAIFEAPPVPSSIVIHNGEDGTHTALDLPPKPTALQPGRWEGWLLLPKTTDLMGIPTKNEERELKALASKEPHAFEYLKRAVKTFREREQGFEGLKKISPWRLFLQQADTAIAVAKQQCLTSHEWLMGHDKEYCARQAASIERQTQELIEEHKRRAARAAEGNTVSVEDLMDS